jgi:putative oxidoreductase
MKSITQSMLTALLILLFIYAAISKLIVPVDFRAQLYRQPFSHGMADALFYLLPAAEVIAAGLLCFNRTVLTGLVFSLLLLLSFTIYVTLGVLHFWAKIPCSCGGILSHMGWGAHLVFNIFFIGLNIVAIGLYLRLHPTRPMTSS